MNNDKTILGYQWEDINRAQQGGSLETSIRGPVVRSRATEKDLELLEKHGPDGLRELGMFGVLDRLQIGL